MALPDLQSLDHLLLALPCALRLFHDEGPRILEGVLNHAVKAESMAEQVTETMRLVSLVQSPASLAVAAAGLNAFKDAYIHNDTVKLKPNLPSTKAPPLPVIFSNPAPGFSARKLLLLSRRITSLAFDCFDFFYDQWKQATPQHLANPRDSYRDGRPRLPWRKSFQGCPYKFDPGGPPYWIEMQHILDGLWNVQLIYELNNTAKEARLPWPAADVALAGTLDPSTLFRLERLEAVVSVLYFFSQIRDAHGKDLVMIGEVTLSSGPSSSQIHIHAGSSWRSNLGFPQAHSEVRRVEDSVWQSRVLSGRGHYCNFERTVEDSWIPQSRFITINDATRFGWDVAEGNVEPSEGLEVFENYGIDKGEAMIIVWEHVNYSPAYEARRYGMTDVRLPDMRQFSDFAFLQWRSACEATEGCDVRKLRFFFRHHIVYPPSFNIAVDALRRRGIEQIPAWPNTAIFRPDDDDEGFYAMLGEAHGAGAAFVLNQHKAELGLLRINEIHVWAEDDDFDTRQEFTEPNDPALYMWMAIERVQSS
ncbi:hypothetical protein S40293_10088 [Stachybotrys chartarum IBT 40293]|nr:hypothetical protein S40293_10088 [Stachybotrys chartarum IBT 40293]